MQILIRWFSIYVGLWAGFTGAIARADPVPNPAKVTNHPATEATTNSLLFLDQVLRDVLTNNPSLKAARANWEAMKQRVPQARAWEDLRGGIIISPSGRPGGWVMPSAR
jgi:hypothetical protein